MPKPSSQSPTKEHFSTLYICLSVFSTWFRGLPHPAELIVTCLHPWLLWRKQQRRLKEQGKGQSTDRERWKQNIVSHAEGSDWQVKEVEPLPLVPESQESTCCLWSPQRQAGQGQLPPSHFRLLLPIWASCPGAAFCFCFGWVSIPSCHSLHCSS